MSKETGSWAAHEFGQAGLGDERRSERLVTMAKQRAMRPHASIGQCCGGQAETKAAYRWYDNEQIHWRQVVASHSVRTAERVAKEKVVLAIQDTTEFDFTHRPGMAGRGPISGHNCQGLLVHTTLAATPQRLPLGIVQLQMWTRPAKEGEEEPERKRPIGEKESNKWLLGLRATAQLAQSAPATLIVTVCDREGDVYDFFLEAHDLEQALLVRAAQNRLVDSPQRLLWQHVSMQPEAGTVTITVPRQVERPARQAVVSIRYCPVTLKPPKNRPKGEGLPELALWAVLAQEEKPPPGEEAISWLLVTTVAVNDFEAACERVQWYTCRWLVEMVHKVLKSGCLVEERQFDDIENVKRYLALDSVVAWRVLFLVMVGREQPDLSCDAILEAHEWQALYCFHHKTRTPPALPPTLREATSWIAQLGGFLGRKHDGHPGVIVIWRGIQRLADIAASWQIFSDSSP